MAFVCFAEEKKTKEVIPASVRVKEGICALLTLLVNYQVKRYFIFFLAMILYVVM